MLGEAGGVGEVRGAGGCGSGGFPPRGDQPPSAGKVTPPVGL